MKTKKVAEDLVCKLCFCQTVGSNWSKCCVIGSSRAQPHVTEARSALTCGLTYFPNRSVHVPILFRICMFMESMCAYSPYLVGWLRNFTLKRGTVARGRGGLGAQHSWHSCFTVQPVLQLEFWNFGNMFLKSLSTYNLHKKKTKKIL